MLAGKAPIIALQSVVAGRAVHVLFTAGNICAVEAIQVCLGNLRYQAPVWDGLGHSINGSHASGLGIEVLHDVLDAVPDILQELLSNAGLCVQLRDAEMDAGQAG